MTDFYYEIKSQILFKNCDCKKSSSEVLITKICYLIDIVVLRFWDWENFLFYFFLNKNRFTTRFYDFQTEMVNGDLLTFCSKYQLIDFTTKIKKHKPVIVIIKTIAMETMVFLDWIFK